MTHNLTGDLLCPYHCARHTRAYNLVKNGYYIDKNISSYIVTNYTNAML